MTTDTAWIAALRPGDEVVIDKGKYGAIEYEIVKVVRVTPSGRLVVLSENPVGEPYERTYRPDGREHSAEMYHRTYLREATPELRQRIADMAEHERLETQIRRTNWANAPLAQLRAIAAILDGQE